MKPPINIEYVDANVLKIILFIFMGQSERLWNKGRFHQWGHDHKGRSRMIIEKLDGRLILLEEDRTRPIIEEIGNSKPDLND